MGVGVGVSVGVGAYVGLAFGVGVDICGGVIGPHAGMPNTEAANVAASPKAIIAFLTFCRYLDCICDRTI